jgi:hypothetical protein
VSHPSNVSPRLMSMLPLLPPLVVGPRCAGGGRSPPGACSRGVPLVGHCRCSLIERHAALRAGGGDRRVVEAGGQCGPPQIRPMGPGTGGGLVRSHEPGIVRSKVTFRDSEALREVPSGQGRPTFDEGGVDLTLIREYLKLTPVERLRSLQNAVRAIGKFRRIAKSTPR